MNDLIEQATLLMTAEAMWEYTPPDGEAVSIHPFTDTSEDDVPLFV